MDSDYPPLPPSRAIDALLHSMSISSGDSAAQINSASETLDLAANDHGCDPGRPSASVKVIVPSGDVILEYAPVITSKLRKSETTAILGWKVSSANLVQNSPYFRALLDPNKFSEGRHFMRQKQKKKQPCGVKPKSESVGRTTSFMCQDSEEEEDVLLPTIRLPGNHIPPRLGVDAIELFLRMLCFDSLDDEEKKDFDAEVKTQRLSLIARLVELADAFNSPEVVRDSLQRSGYALGRAKFPLTRFNSSMLKFTEDRIRQTILIARFLNNQPVFQTFTHTLIVTGSKHWVNGIERADPDAPRWYHFSEGLEEELYYRRQCILNTITNLQAHFLRMYGALEEPVESKTAVAVPTPSPAANTTQSRQYQCRCGLGNSSACDAFHLGQMTRFFAVRTKTIFLGSTLIDLDFSSDVDEEEEEEGEEEAEDPTHVFQSAGGGAARPPPDLKAIVSSLKQCPDYQIDVNHTACGIRRRILPPLDCIEGFIGDERGLLGVNLQYWKGGKWPLVPGSWASRSLRRALVIDIRLSRINGVPLMSRGTSGSGSREEDARLLFTAKKRNWEA